MRLFVSVDLEGLEREIADVQDLFAGASGLDFTDPGACHVTLKFLGETDENRLSTLTDELSAAVEAAGVSPFEAHFGGVGVFPHLEYITVVWVGVERGGDELARLHSSIEDRTVAMGFDPEDHDFTPHATVARMKHAGGKQLVRDVVQNHDPTVGSLCVTDVRLTESTLSSDGPEYTTVESFDL